MGPNGAVPERQITVFLADDNLLEGVRALINLVPDLVVVGAAADYDRLAAGTEAAAAHVVVTDIRSPPSFQREVIDAAKEVRSGPPGTGAVVLSQYDDPEYAIALLAEGSARYAFRLADADQLARAIRDVATGGSLREQWAEADQTVLSQATAGALGDGVALERLELAQVTGWDATVHAYRLVEGGT